MKTTTKIESFEQRTSMKTGKTYHVFHTVLGEMSAFEGKIVENLKAYVGTEAAIEIEYTDTNGFKNIKKILGKAPIGAVIENKAITEARSSKDTSMYTSYAKDIFGMLYAGEKILEEKREDNVKGISIVTNFELMRRAIELVKQAREEFK